MKLSRRGFLGAAGALTLTSCGLDASPGQTAELLTSKTPLPEAFKVPLPIRR